MFWTDPFDRPLTAQQLVSEFGLDVAESTDELWKGETSNTFGQGLLNTYFRFRSYGDLDEFVAHGRAVHELENRAFREDVELNPEWSDVQVLDALRNHGAKFGADAEQTVKSRLPAMVDLEGLLGGTPQITSTRFEIRADDSTRRALLHWLVRVEVKRSKRPNDTAAFVFFLEPFGGKLTQFVREVN